MNAANRSTGSEDTVKHFASSEETLMRAIYVFVLCTLLGCASGKTDEGPTPENFEGPAAPVAHDAFVIAEAGYCSTVAQPGLTYWDRDVLTTCPDSIALDEGAPCTVAELVGTTTRAVDVADVRLALRARSGLVVLKTNGALVLRTTSGTESTLTAWAAEPSVAADGVRVAFLTVAEGAAVPSDGVVEPGTPLRLVLYDLRDSVVRTIAEDADASSPFVVPNSDDVVYVSSRSGLASIWRGNGEYEIQITNVGLESGDQGVLPTFGNHVVWVPGTRTLAFEVQTTESTIWQYDVALGTIEALGPGAWPQIAPDGTVLAASALSSDPACAVTYLANIDP